MCRLPASAAIIAMLKDPGTEFPVFVDPGFSSARITRQTAKHHARDLTSGP